LDMLNFQSFNDYNREFVYTKERQSLSI